MMRIRLLAFILLSLCSTTPAAEPAEALRLVPFPKVAKLDAGRFRLDRTLVLEVPEPAKAAAAMLADEWRQAGLPAPVVRAAGEGRAWLLYSGDRPASPPALPAIENPSGEAYALVIATDCVAAEGRTLAGTLHSLNTLLQLVRANRQDNAIPCLAIRDWPSLRWRAFQDDMTRGPSSKLATLQGQAALGALLKLNLMTYYMEYQYEFRKHPEIGPKEGSMSADELRALVAFARPLGVDILGNQQSFGHWGAILKHPQYANLRENGEVLTPVRDETYALLDDLYSEVIPHLPFEFFNVCCDETAGLGSGPSKELAAKIGVGGVYAQHIRRLHDLLRNKYGKRMMMWGDIILQHPDHLKEIPRDTIMLTWGYDPRPNFEDQIIPFSKSGYEFFVCPGVNNWNRILPDFAAANVNIRNFVRDGARHGAMGMLNTDWLDDGEGLKGHKWHGMAWGAECAWNASTTSIEQFNRRIGAVMFGEKGDHFGQAIALLSQPGLSGLPNRRFWDNDLVPHSEGHREAARKLLSAVRPAIEHLELCRKEATTNAWIIDSYLLGAKRIERMAQRILDGWEAAEAVRDAQAAPPAVAAELLAKAEKIVRANGAEHAALGTRFAELWLAESKPYALDRTTRRYDAIAKEYDSLAGRIAKAREAALAGKCPPSPREIGLALPRIGRLAPPDAVIDRPLLPDAPWAAPSVQRLGIVIESGSADRVDLPVEIEVAIPSDKPQPVAAWRIDGDRPVAMAAQIDAGKTQRLTLVVPGRIAAGKSAAIHVYIGAAPADAPSVKATDVPDGNQWIDTGAARILLGREGAHLYRWEVKSANGLDLTLDGESGYAGFSDAGGAHRSSANQLTRLSAGPAVVRYRALDGVGLSRTISVYAGASWAEVQLDTPLSYYWDFDDAKHFGPDTPSPGTYLFSNGATGPVRKLSDDLASQVSAGGIRWAAKFNGRRQLVGMVLLDRPGRLIVGPGGNMGGIGVQGPQGHGHFVTVAGVFDREPAKVMGELLSTLDPANPPRIILHAMQQRP